MNETYCKEKLNILFHVNKKKGSSHNTYEISMIDNFRSHPSVTHCDFS